jgi:cell wall-associated NlpC family hydrolase
MALHYQYARADGSPDWTGGQEEFDHVWENATDSLRFHKGAGFVIVDENGPGPKRKLWELDTFLKAQLNSAKPDTPVKVKSLRDSFGVVFRRHEVSDPKAQQLIDAIARKVGQPYVFGGLDCSGLVLGAVYAVTNILLPHNADAMRADSRFKTISAGEAKKGDFIFVDRDSRGVEHHVATILGKNLDKYPGGLVVWDTEPSNTTTPSGWPTPYLGTGVRIRPGFNPWYCGNISSFARLAAING